MADKDKDDFGTKVISGLAAMAAAFLARKLLTFAWTKATGKEPPTNPEDPQVALAEALSWSVLAGVTVAAVRVLAIRAASRKDPRRRRTASQSTPRTPRPRTPGRQAGHCGLRQADSGGAQGSTANT